MRWPWGMAFDSSGNLYIADMTNNAIRKVTISTGIITTYAGTGTASYSGDGGVATSATLNDPQGVCIDTSGANIRHNIIHFVSITYCTIIYTDR